MDWDIEIELIESNGEEIDQAMECGRRGQTNQIARPR
jgi:hypothetical protein